MENCFTGIILPQTIIDPCNGEIKSTDCVATPSALEAIDIVAGATQTQINTALVSAIIFKDEQIQELTEQLEPFINRKIFRGTFLGSTLNNIVEDTIEDVAIVNTGVGIYSLTSDLFTISTNILITPNGIPAGYDDVTVSYDYANANGGTIIFRIKNNGVLVDLAESPIKIEI